ncbi:MAG TPA: S8 family serine peptidase [Candidatus Aquilonibacter sp.]|nr:S8 family serine peptidase [Candidatus Aquilonibacter sp.]
MKMSLGISRLPHMRRGFVLVVLSLLGAGAGVAQAPKQKITRAADLPQFSYPISGSVEDLLQSDEAFAKLTAQIRKDVESVLNDYDIQESATKRSLVGTLANIDVLEGKDQDALRLLDEVQALQDKPGEKLTSGLVLRAVLETRGQYKDRNSPEYRAAVAKLVRQRLDAMPFAVVQDDIKQDKTRYELLSQGLIVGELQSVFDPVIQKSGAISNALADQLPNAKLTLVEILPLKEALADVFSSYLAANTKEKPDIWAGRDVRLEPGKNYTPVDVGIWDSGVDISIFEKQLIRQPAGQPAVVAYDLNSRKTTGALYTFPPGHAGQVPALMNRIKGFVDVQANIDSPEASAVKKQIATLKPDQVGPFLEQLDEVADYLHGTHVAGIAVAGNPYARLAVARMTFDYKTIPDPCPSRELSERFAASAIDAVGFFKANHVRVVNMSWGGSRQDDEDSLERCGMGKSIDERKQMARELFDIEKRGMESAFASAPEILFVAAAGNSNSDATFDEFIPSSIETPNLLTVGAVDQAGDEAPFTSYGPTVVVDSDGYEVESYVPGGERMKLSGTSMAAPNVTNLAAKILAVNPGLKPAEVIGIIRNTADATPDGRRHLINPKKAMAAAMAR